MEFQKIRFYCKVGHGGVSVIGHFDRQVTLGRGQIIFDPSEFHELIFGKFRGSLISEELLLIELFKRLMLIKGLSTNEKECALLLMLTVIITLTLVTSKLTNLSNLSGKKLTN